jgi:hypothetical protein
LTLLVPQHKGNFAGRLTSHSALNISYYKRAHARVRAPVGLAGDVACGLRRAVRYVRRGANAAIALRATARRAALRVQHDGCPRAPRSTLPKGGTTLDGTKPTKLLRDVRVCLGDIRDIDGGDGT